MSETSQPSIASRAPQHLSPVPLSADSVEFLSLGLCGYQEVMDRMRDWTDRRGDHTEDQVWLLEHPAVFTQGVSCSDVPMANPFDIPVVKSDRGGQITYHGPGQLIAYFLIDLKRRKMGVRQLVRLLEEATIELLSDAGLQATARPGAPGVYVGDAKIAALGLRVRAGRSYHGLSLNVAMDLEPFGWINPCGFQGLEVTSMEREGVVMSLADASARFTRSILARL
ncbi:MAG: lipoyl(octanoyl) transferase LipB [Gammaproteobacteria bacterium]